MKSILDALERVMAAALPFADGRWGYDPLAMGAFMGRGAHGATRAQWGEGRIGEMALRG